MTQKYVYLFNEYDEAMTRAGGVSMNASMPEKATISSNLRAISPRFMPRIAP